MNGLVRLRDKEQRATSRNVSLASQPELASCLSPGEQASRQNELANRWAPFALERSRPAQLLSLLQGSLQRRHAPASRQQAANRRQAHPLGGVVAGGTLASTISRLEVLDRLSQQGEWLDPESLQQSSMRLRHRHAPAKPNQRHLPLKPSSFGYTGGVTVRQRATSAAATTLVKGLSCVACQLSEKAFAGKVLQRHPRMSLGAGGKEWRLRGVPPGMVVAEVR